MSKILIIAIVTIFSVSLSAQQFYLEAFVGRNLSNYSKAPYQNDNNWYSPTGIRIAAGADHVQAGAEYSQNLTSPNWTFEDAATGEKLGRHEFQTSYYGAFLRTKIAKYPARRFGVTLMAGAGYYDTVRTSSIPSETPSLAYNKTLGYNGGIGIAIPTVRSIMIELAYHYYYVGYEKTADLPQLNGNFHSLQAGLSMNLVFGKRAQEYTKLGKR